MATSQDRSPTVPPPTPDGLNSALARNIEALTARRREEERKASIQEKIAAVVTAFTGSMAFVYVHLAIVAAWVAANVGLISALPKFDPTFVILATATSVEAIFLSTFVLISQNRASAAADRRADLDLQVNLLAEHEVTRLIGMVAAVMRRLDIGDDAAGNVEELQRDVAPEAILDTIASKAEETPEDGSAR